MNTNFFHKYAYQRRQTNTINNITDEDGNKTIFSQEMSQIFQNFYQELFTISELKEIAEFQAYAFISY